MYPIIDEQLKVDELIGLDPKNKQIRLLVIGNLEKYKGFHDGVFGRNEYMIYHSDGYLDAVDCLNLYDPDMILIDALSDNISAFDISRNIKSIQSGKAYLCPVIFVTENNEQKILDCYKNGGNDYLCVDDGVDLLKAKIQANYQNKIEFEYVSSHNKELVYSHESYISSMEIAEKIINNISRSTNLNNANINYTTMPMEILSGDLILYARTPSGVDSYLVADFTGHGLGAAIGAMIVSDVFYTMIKKEESIEDIVYELNYKLKKILPTGKFMAVCIIDVIREYTSIEVFNAGLPSILIRSKKPGIEIKIQSEHVPLGILNPEDMHIKPKKYRINRGDRIYVYTDGLTESQNISGEIFGSARMEKCFNKANNPQVQFTTILEENKIFCGGAKQTDDITLLEIICDDPKG